MLFYSIHETMLIVFAAIIVDLIIGDPKWPTHPVILIGRWISWLEQRLMPGAGQSALSPGSQRLRGVLLLLAVTLLSLGMTWLIIIIMTWIHPWLGCAASIWLISTTIAIKGLKDAAYRVLKPMREGRIGEARTYTGYIVGRDTTRLDNKQLTRAVVETVAENTVDAVLSPIVFALLGGAPLAMFYRATNTLDSMVGYRNKRYLHFGWASARWDDVLNWIPARLTGLLLVISAWFLPGLSAIRSARAIFVFAAKHPSPNSGIPESAVAGAIGIQLGGTNYYDGAISERAQLGWPQYELQEEQIKQAVRLLYGTSFLVMGGLLLCALVL